MTSTNAHGRAALEGAALAAEVARRLAVREGEVAVLGLGRSGEAAARLVAAAGLPVYVSDASSAESVQASAQRLAMPDARYPDAARIEARAGAHDLARIARASIVVASPGIPPDAAPLRAAREAGVPIVSEVEIALRLSPGLRVIATTGTNGKTTTTAMVGHFLRALGHDAMDVGNIGAPISAAVLRDPRPTWAALEMSSFQLHDTPGIMPEVGILTNLGADHLDRYRDVAEYHADKARLFANATPLSRWVVNADDAASCAMVEHVAGRVYRFSATRVDVDAWYDRANGTLVVAGREVVSRERLSLPGDHNVANALAALLAVSVADAAHETPEARRMLAQSFATFHALPHRLEPVADRDGVLWLDDSKATNVSSTLVALQGMTRPTVLLLGGRHKGEPYTALVEQLRRIGRAVIAYGEAVHEITQDLDAPLAGRVPVHAMRGASFDDVVRRAREVAQRGDVILLSPACSSYDMFTNFEERGRTFAALAGAPT